MSARSESSVQSDQKFAPQAPDGFGGLAAMRQTLNDLSLDGLASLLDDELTLDSPASESHAPQASTPDATALINDGVASPPAIVAEPSVPGESYSETPSAESVELTVTQSPLAGIRRSSLDRTHFLRSSSHDSQATVDLSAVRRSASEPTQAFDPAVHMPANADDPTMTTPLAKNYDAERSSSVETAFWSEEDRKSARLLDGEPTIQLSSPPKDQSPASEAESEIAPSAEASSTDDPASSAGDADHAATVTSAIVERPKSATQLRWEEAAEQDGQFTTMMLSDLEDLPWRNDPSPEPEVENVAVTDDEADRGVAEPSPESLVESDSDAFSLQHFDAEQPGAELSTAATSIAMSAAAPIESANVPAQGADRSGTHGSFREPTPELRALATTILERITPGVATVVALVGCEETLPGARATLGLAAALADSTGLSTLAVDGDFERRDLSRLIGSTEAPGFAESLLQPAKIPALAQSLGRDDLQALPAGAAPIDSAEALGRLSGWIARAKQEHALILVWLGVPDADFERRLCGAADAAALFAVVGKDRPSRIESVAATLRDANARSIGAVLTSA